MSSTLAPMNPRVGELEAALAKTQRRLRLFQAMVLVIGLGLILFFSFGDKTINFSSKKAPTSDLIDKNAPFYKEVKATIDPLLYSFVPILKRPDIRISVDFKRNFWILHNIHLFDKNHQVVLVENRYGLCGDLAAYTYQKLKPLFEPKYKVQFVRAAESHFFPAPLNSHFLLSIINNSDPNDIYIVDPSFQRYGPLSSFNDYLFFEHLPTLTFMAQKRPDHTELINRGVPVLIKNNVKLTLIMTPENNQFNEENFAFGILATHKNTYIPRNIYRVSLSQGEKKIYTNEEEIKKMGDIEELPELTALIDRFFEQIRINSKNTTSERTSS